MTNQNTDSVYPVSACTDITGFGLLGHSSEMASASEVTFELQVKDIAYMTEAIEYAKMGLVPAGAYRNRQHSGKMVDASIFFVLRAIRITVKIMLVRDNPFKMYIPIIVPPKY